MSCGKRKIWQSEPQVCSTFRGPTFLSVRTPSKPHATPLFKVTFENKEKKVKKAYFEKLHNRYILTMNYING